MDESIAVAPSEESGNLSVETEPTPAPAEPAEPVAPPVEEPATPAEPAVELFDLPDGRKVDAATLSKEWKDNFLPDYTKKSQALAAQEQPINKPTNPLDDPAYVPKTYAELAAQIEAQTLAKIEAKEQARIDQSKALETAVDAQLTEVKTLDPSVSENALFLHATKYGFRDLRQAHQNMKDMSELAKKVQTTTAQNIAKRTDPVSSTPGATGARPAPSQFATAQDYLRAVKASGV